MNLCHPDNTKSCAACCGLYNVPVATKDALTERLAVRTSLFRDCDRSPDAIQSFERAVIALEGGESLDPDIHVCRFVGFLDPLCRTVGCLLHPSAPGNAGQDLRGLCYYGSLACKTFFCDSWNMIPEKYLLIISDLIDDWHLWGLVSTDAEYVLSLFALTETALQETISPLLLRQGPGRDILISMLRWKNEWPFAKDSTQRLSRYYHRPRKDLRAASNSETTRLLARCLDSTFGSGTDLNGPSLMIRSIIEEFARSYKRLNQSSGDRANYNDSRK